MDSGSPPDTHSSRLLCEPVAEALPVVEERLGGCVSVCDTERLATPLDVALDVRVGVGVTVRAVEVVWDAVAEPVDDAAGALLPVDV